MSATLGGLAFAGLIAAQFAAVIAVYAFNTPPLPDIMAEAGDAICVTAPPVERR
jgi:hypothetical protein